MEWRLIIGQIGFDPGAQWGSGLTSTQNNTLVRNPNITNGDANGTDAFDPAMEWIGSVSYTHLTLPTILLV